MADDDTNDEPTEAELRKFNIMFHKAASERDARLEKKLLKGMDGMLGSKFDELRTVLADSDSTSDDDSDDDDDVVIPHAGNPGQPVVHGGASPEERARLRRAEAAAKEASAKADKYQKQFEEEQARRTHAEERQTLISVITPHVKPKLLDIAAEQLHKRNLVRDPDSNQLLWREDDGTILPLKDGAAAWSKSDVGKEFAPPVEARGRGGRGPDGNGYVTPGKMTVEDLGSIVTGSIPGQRH